VAPENPFQSQAEAAKAQSPDLASRAEEERPKYPRAWQPFTPRGVTAFACASAGRVFLVQAIMAFLSAGTIVWFVWFGWRPEIKEAIRNLPAEGTIENQQLKAQINPASPLADGRGLLGIAADPEDKGGAGLRADLKVQLRKDHYEICFLLGCKSFSYPPGQSLQFNRLDLEPRWEAWEPFLLAAVGAAAWLFIFSSWLVLAALYFPLVFLLAHLKKRQVSLGGSWRLAGAALMPGAALLSIGIVCYGLGFIDLVRLFTLIILHLVVGWVYLILSSLTLPAKVSTPSPLNPFSPAELGKTAPAPTNTQLAPPPSSPASDDRGSSHLDNPS
jgi:hypothetical protein